MIQYRAHIIRVFFFRQSLELDSICQLRIACKKVLEKVKSRAAKKGGSMVAMLSEGNRQDHSWQKNFGQLYDICHILE